MAKKKQESVNTAAPLGTDQPPAATAGQEEAAAIAAAENEGMGAGANTEPEAAEDTQDADATDAAAEKADELAMLGRLTPVERAMVAFGLEHRHVLGSKVYELEGGEVEIVIVTQGGQRVRWPNDAGRELSPMEKGDAVPAPVPAGIMPAAKA